MHVRHQSSKHVDIAELLSKPTWSVRSLLPTDEQIGSTDKITDEELDHLFRLSALPLKDLTIPEEKKKHQSIKRDLLTQLHFVQEIQKVDTTGVEPLVAIRDETEAGKMEATIDMSDPDIRKTLRSEVVKGRNMRPRRRRDAVVDTRGAEDWDALSTAKYTLASRRYFVVNSSSSWEIPDGWLRFRKINVT